MTKSATLTGGGAQKKTGHTYHLSGSSLGLKTDDFARVASKVEVGFSYAMLKRFQKNSGLPLEAITTVVQIPARTLARRKANGKLTHQESEQLYRLALLFEGAVNLFEGDFAAARQWLTTPKRVLARLTPLAAARTEIGARKVEDLIGRLEHGVFS